jgi:uncharacterized protein
MKYLLDVNVLVALGLEHHQFHDRVTGWIERLRRPALATCAITELGFVRVLAQAPAYGLTVAQAQTLLLRVKRADICSFTFIGDNCDLSRLPAWVKRAGQTTDGHLAELAAASDATLATLDAKIPGSLLIP